MNILLTNYCNAGCVYCFAANTIKAGRQSQTPDDKLMSLQNLSTILQYIKVTMPNEPIRLLGGEPTLYPHLEEAIQMILNNGFKTIEIFSNGFIYKEKLMMLKKYLDHVCFVWNINPAGMSYVFLEKLIDNTLCELSTPLNAIGFNIYKTDYNPSFIFSYLDKHPHLSHVRIGIAHPMGSSEITQKQAVIRIEDYPKVGKIIYEFARGIIKHYPQIKSINLDCGYTPCLFTDSQFKFMTTKIPFYIHESCSPSLTDISTNMLVNPCFATSAGKEKYRLTDFKNLRQALEYNKARWHFTRKYLPKINLSCSKCKHTNRCFLGCGGERILEAKRIREKWIRQIRVGKLDKIKKAITLFKVGRSYGATYEHDNAIHYLDLTQKEIVINKLNNPEWTKKFNQKVSAFTHELNAVYCLDSYKSIEPEIDLYHEYNDKLLKIKNLYVTRPTLKFLKEYTALISNIIFRIKLAPQPHLPHYQKELKEIEKQKKQELGDYLKATRKKMLSTDDALLTFSYASLLKKYSGNKTASQFLRNYKKNT